VSSRDGAGDAPTLERLAASGAFIFDVDGCLVLGDAPGGIGGRAVPGAADLVSGLKRRGARLLCCTNGSGRPPEAYAASLRGHGLDVEDAEMLTPPVIAADWLARERAGATVMVVSGEGVTEPLRRAGVTVVAPDPGTRADVVFVGPVRELTATHVQVAAEAIWAGAEFLVTSYAPAIPGRHGRFASTSAAAAAGLAHVTGAEPTIVGKPSRLVVDVATGRLGCAPEDIVVVGDDPTLDIAVGRAAGAATVLVLSGIVDAGDVAALPESQRPDVVIADVGELLAALTA
jgi:HAD superfamily hydrolase (TIGR01450 family)